MKIFLIRHGRQCSKLCNVDVDLSEEGYRQASLLGERLFHENIQVVYSSNLLRAVETAQAANLYWNVEHIIRPELREISFGHMEGMEDRDIAVKYRDFKAQQAPYGGGSALSGRGMRRGWVRRAEPVFREMTESGYERIAVVTHGGVIRSMTAHCLGIPMNKWRILGKNLENCSITELNWDGVSGRFTLERFNDYAHLEPYPDLLRKGWVSAEN